jgi:hypothetical protein
MPNLIILANKKGAIERGWGQDVYDYLERYQAVRDITIITHLKQVTQIYELFFNNSFLETDAFNKIPYIEKFIYNRYSVSWTHYATNFIAGSLTKGLYGEPVVCMTLYTTTLTSRVIKVGD